MFTPAKCLFHRDKFLHGGKILSVISLLPGDCLSTVKYGTVWCGNERDSVAAYGRLYYSKQLASFFMAFLSTGSLPMRGVLLFIIDIKLGLGIWPKSVEDGKWYMSCLRNFGSHCMNWPWLIFLCHEESRCQIQAFSFSRIPEWRWYL